MAIPPDELPHDPSARDASARDQPLAPHERESLSRLGASRPVALVTGGAKRVGAAIACEFARRGLDVLITYRTSAADAERTAAALREKGVSAAAVRADFSDPARAEALGVALAGAVRRLDVLVLSASAYGSSSLAETSAARAHAFMNVNALAPLLLCKSLSPTLAASPRPEGAAIVALADMHALGRPRVGYAAYMMSKAALVEMVRSLARELAPRVRVNAIGPGVVAWPERAPSGAQATSPPLPDASDGDMSDAERAAYLSRVPLARAGTPEEAAKSVAWLALDASYITGEIVRLDGGRWLA